MERRTVNTVDAAFLAVFLFASTFALIQLTQRKRKQWMMVGEGRGVVSGLAAFTLTVIKSVSPRDDETQLSEFG